MRPTGIHLVKGSEAGMLALGSGQAGSWDEGVASLEDKLSGIEE